MKLTDDRIAGINLVRSYAPGVLRIGDTALHRSCLIRADRLIARLAAADDRGVACRGSRCGVRAGAGDRRARLRHSPAIPATLQLIGAVLSRGIGCEVMDTGAACRTYNILASEDRKVVAALLLRGLRKNRRPGICRSCVFLPSPGHQSDREKTRGTEVRSTQLALARS